MLLRSTTDSNETHLCVSDRHRRLQAAWALVVGLHLSMGSLALGRATALLIHQRVLREGGASGVKPPPLRNGPERAPDNARTSYDVEASTAAGQQPADSQQGGEHLTPLTASCCSVPRFVAIVLSRQPPQPALKHKSRTTPEPFK